MTKQQDLPKVYFEKARRRFLWLSIFSMILIFLNLYYGDIFLGMCSTGLYFIFLTCRVLLKTYPIVPIIISGILGIGFTIISVIVLSNSLIWNEKDFFFKYDYWNLYRLLLDILIIYINFLLISSFYFSLKWAAEKATMDRNFNTLDEDEIIL